MSRRGKDPTFEIVMEVIEESGRRCFHPKRPLQEHQKEVVRRVDGMEHWAVKHLKPGLPPGVWKGFQGEIDEWHENKKQLLIDPDANPHWSIVLFPRKMDTVLWTSKVPFKIEITLGGTTDYCAQVGPLSLENQGNSRLQGQVQGQLFEVLLQSLITPEWPGDQHTMFKYKATPDDTSIEPYDPDIICGDPPF